MNSTQIKAGIVLGCCMLVGVVSCKKRVVVIPEACMQADKTEVHAGDTVTFTNCSIAEQTDLIFFKGEMPPLLMSSVQFDARGKFRKCFNDTGKYTVLIRAINPQGPLGVEQRSVLTIQP
jgi:hypothetical protein